MDNSWIEETIAGFYKQEEESWIYAPNFVSSLEFELLKELKDTYTYPVEGWTWYDEQPEAYLLWLELLEKENINNENTIDYELL